MGKKKDIATDQGNEVVEEVKVEEIKKKVLKTKRVKNYGNSRVELFVDGESLVILPKQTVTVPYDLEIPSNLGLEVK